MKSLPSQTKGSLSLTELAEAQSFLLRFPERGNLSNLLSRFAGGTSRSIHIDMLRNKIEEKRSATGRLRFCLISSLKIRQMVHL